MEVPSLLLLPLGVLLCMLVYLAIWFKIASSVLLSGGVVSNLLAMSTLAKFYFAGQILLLLWTIAYLRGVQRFSTASNVSQWYFHRHQDSNQHNRASMETPTNSVLDNFAVWPHLKRAVTLSTGTIAISALLVSFAQMIHMGTIIYQRVTTQMQWQSRFNPLNSSRSALSGLLVPLAALLHLVTDAMVAYALVYSAVYDEAFLEAAKHATHVFRRNLLYGSSSDAIAVQLFWAGSWIVGLTSGISVWVYGTHELGSYHAWLLGIVTYFLGWSIARCISGTFQDV